MVYIDYLGESITISEGGVVAAVALVVFESDVTAAVSTVPNGLVFAFLGFVSYRLSVGSAKIVVDSRVARLRVVACGCVQFGALHIAAAIVFDNSVGPCKAEFADVSQVHLVAVVSIDVVTAAVEVIERLVVGRSESYAEDAADVRAS